MPLPLTDSLPKGWHDISVSQFMELVESDKVKWDSNIEKLLDQLAILLDVANDDPTIEQLDVDDVFDLFKGLGWLTKPIPGSVSHRLLDMELKPWNKLNLGEFIDIENLVVADPINNLTTLCAIAYRKVVVDSWGHLSIEPYNYELAPRKELFDSVPITAIYGLIKSYNDYRAEFLANYDQLFQDSSSLDPELDDQDSLELTGLDLIQHNKELAKQRSIAKWSWESTIWNLSNQDITKFDQIFNTPLILVFNVLSMRSLMGG